MPTVVAMIYPIVRGGGSARRGAPREQHDNPDDPVAAMRERGQKIAPLIDAGANPRVQREFSDEVSSV